MYIITEGKLAGKTLFTISHNETRNYVSILAGYGGGLNEFVVNGKKILCGAVTGEEFDTLTVKKFSGSFLFPYPNRVSNAQYDYEGNTFYLPANDTSGFPHSLHGLLYNQIFDIDEIIPNEGKVVLKHHFRPIKDTYPFGFVLKTAYILNIDTLEICTSVFNAGDKPAPFGLGWHPYIRICNTIDNCYLKLPSSNYYLTDEKLIPTGEIGHLDIFNELSKISDIQLNHCFAMPGGSLRNITVLEDTDGYIIELEQNGYAYTQYYTPPDRHSIAIEPQTCIPDALNNKTGLLFLDPGKTIEFSFKIKVTKSAK